jgi:hypothetical protein
MLVGRLSSWICAVLITGGAVSLRAQILLPAQGSATSAPGAGLVALGWNPSPDTNVTGYFLCWGYAPGQCTNRLDAGNVTNTAIAGLSVGVSYCFTVVAYDSTGRESVPSNEIACQAPAVALKLSAGVVLWASTGRVAQLSFQGQAGAVYQVQATSDFRHWDNILRTNCLVAGPILIRSEEISRTPCRFYRLRMLHQIPSPPGQQ